MERIEMSDLLDLVVKAHGGVLVHPPSIRYGSWIHTPGAVKPGGCWR
jgi:hypothetical protein